MPYDNKRPPSDPGQGAIRPASGIPARSADRLSTRPPFPPGNAMHLTHGAKSPRVFLPLAEQLAAGLTHDRPDLARYPGEVAAWAEWEARAMLMRRYLADVGYLDDDGVPRKEPTKWLTTCENAASRARAALGLTPFTEAALAKERAAASLVAVDLEAIAERGREALARRVSAGELPESDAAGELLSALAEQNASAYAWSAAEHAAAQCVVVAATTTTATATPGTDTDHQSEEA